jgi:hypothetical protein
MTEADWPSIAGHGNLPITYNGKLSARNTAITSIEVATVEFLFDWDDGSIRFQQSDVTLGKTSTYQLNTLGIGIAITPIIAISSILATIPPIFESKDTNIATVDQTGKVTAVNPGLTTITATLNGQTASCNITVLDLTVSSTEGGSASLNYNKSDKNVVFTAIPKANYSFFGLFDENDNIISPNIHYKNNLYLDLNLKAKFIQNSIHKKQYKVTLIAGDNGTVVGSGLYDEGSTVTLIAKGNTGYNFVNWSDGNTNSKRTIVINNDLSLTAIFEVSKTKINYLYNGIYYDLASDGTASISPSATDDYLSNNTSLSGEVIIPENIVDENNTTYKVTSIGHNAFYECNKITSISIPNSVVFIDNSAFYNCSSLTTITMPDSIKFIGKSAFYNCSALTNIRIPKSITSINDNTFYGCTGLKDIEIPESAISIEPFAFYNCTGFTNLIIPNSVTSIKYEAFYGCTGLINVTIPNSVTFIGDAAFNNCNLPEEQAFIYAYNTDGSKNKTKLISYGGSNTDIIIPSSVTSIGDYAFREISKLKHIDIPNSVTSIGIGAFYNCKALDNIVIPNSVNYMGEMAFLDCSGLTNVTLSNSIKSIGNYTFHGCVKLTDITIPTSVTSIGKYAFYKCIKLTNIMIPNSILSIDNYAFGRWTNSQTITLQNRIDMSNMTLGYNWKGAAIISYN